MKDENKTNRKALVCKAGKRREMKNQNRMEKWTLYHANLTLQLNPAGRRRAERLEKEWC